MNGGISELAGLISADSLVANASTQAFCKDKQVQLCAVAELALGRHRTDLSKETECVH